MSTPYQQLLDATITHLKSLRDRGITQVVLTASALDQLRSSAPTSRNRLPPATGTSASAPQPPPHAPTLREDDAPEPAPSSRSRFSATPDLPSFAARADSPALLPEAKATAIAEICARVEVCRRCPNLAASRRNVVCGVGDVNSPLLFVGEAPGADEDRQGEPFVGRAGQLLTRIIQTMGFDRKTVYIANILKCRPDTPGQPSGNRKPTPAEMQTCLPFLIEQIEVIRPQVIVALGVTAVEGLLGKSASITRLRGQWQEFRGVPLMPTYHPAYLLRNQAIGEKRKVWEDMLRVLERLGRSISEKQRNYFLKA